MDYCEVRQIEFNVSSLTRVRIASFRKISHDSKTATGDVLHEKVFLDILKNSQGNTRTRVSFLNNLLVLAYSLKEKQVKRHR